VSRLLASLGLSAAMLAALFGVGVNATQQPHIAPAVQAVTVCTGAQILDNLTGLCETQVTTVPTSGICPIGELFDTITGDCVHGRGGRDPYGRDPYYRDNDRDRGPVILTPETHTEVNGNCTTVTTTLNGYRDSVGRWNNLVGRYGGNSRLSPADRASLDGSWRDYHNWQNRWDSEKAAVSKDTTCNNQVPTNLNITVSPAPASYTSPPQVSVTPKGSANTGGFDAVHSR
jgi:hypothetical protein